MNNDNSNCRRRATAEWDAKVNYIKHKDQRNFERKVKSTGRIEVRYGTSLVKIREYLRQGRDVILADANRKPMLRLFACLDKDFTKMYVSAHTMGAFRDDTYAGIRFSVNRGGKEVDTDDVMRERDDHQLRRRPMACVTPDTVVECPKCGYEFRVGKVLNAER